MKRLLLIVPLALVMLLGLNVHLSESQVVMPTAAPASLINSSSFIRSDRLGITFITSADSPADESRFRNALLLGAGWDRWPLYWNRVQIGPGQFNWAAYDRIVADDLTSGLNVDVILLGMPDFYRDGARPAGLHAPIFADGSDTPVPGKSLNPDNAWAQFVFSAVQRYMPGGALARSRGWPNGYGVRVWEIWNEPDYAPFWSGSILDYARLLKVAYIVAHMADPQTQVMFGGLLFNTEDNWLARVLAIYENDPLRETYHWYMDAVAIHSYDYPWRSGWLVRWVKQTLKAYAISRPVWLNESGVPVWNDYPGPTWASAPADHQMRATADQQAWFFVQSAAFAFSEGADKVFFHQLYDDCGNQPGGTDFPPNQGELCATGACFGDAYGLFRNPSGAACFSHHPFAGTPRPSARAYQLVARIFGSIPFANPQVSRPENIATLITFDRIQTNERIFVIWNRTFNETTLDLPAGGDSAQMYTLDNQSTLYPDAAGSYRLTLPPAVPDNFPFLEPGDQTAIGGPPLILVEHQDMPLNVTPSIVETVVGTSAGPLQVTPGPIFAPPPRPTVDPALDRVPPVTSMAPLPETSPATFTVLWHGQDNSGIDRYLVWVRVNGDHWQPWLETTRTQADYTGEPGGRYEFAVWAVDLAGNWSSNTDLQPQALTQVEQ